MLTETEIQEIVDRVSANLLIAKKEVLTLEEAALYLGFERSYLYKLTSRMVIPHSKPLGKKVFFQKGELDEWAKQNRIAPQREIHAKAAAYCQSNNIL